ncbi:SWI/SNF complex subunit SWI3C like [Quillaja saponaria]|uniref:SWI/SNF complex subunit SWI3C like n=1 Tax=Quillaja saponaria TaxID=32244 RepID=A0AAD7M760_QUISA|nr:SWI/SNF complex subunit SWI3C like [Quillaja saponaria]KAJ7970803.1 SWI/SNF complex subunit SWI3C like [Quillaja saponaria]
MAFTAKLIQPLRQSFAITSSSYSSISNSKQFFFGKFSTVKTLLNCLGPPLRQRASVFQNNVNLHGKYLQNFFCSGSYTLRGALHGRKVSTGTILTVSIVFGSINIRPYLSHAIDGDYPLVEDQHLDLLNVPGMEENPQNFWIFARKFWLPVFLFITVLANLDHPITLIMSKVVLFLLSTKPSPLSVYVFIDQLSHQSMLKEPNLYKVKSQYATKVEVEDYKILCLAKIEVQDQKMTLVGILGDWWPLPLLTSQGALSVLRNTA